MWQVQKRKNDYLYCWRYDITSSKAEYKIFSLWDLDKFSIDVVYLDKSLTRKTDSFYKAKNIIISLVLHFRNGCNNEKSIVKKRLYHFKNISQISLSKLQRFEEKAKSYGFKLLERTNCD